jgi:hypothetical protein
MSDETITFLVLGVVVAVFICDHVPVAAVALGTALTLWARASSTWSRRSRASATRR